MGSNTDFTYTMPDGKTVTVPSLAKMNAGIMRRTRRLDEEDRVWTILEFVCDADTIAAIDDLDAEQFEAFMAAWQKHSGVSVGESQAS